VSEVSEAYIVAGMRSPIGRRITLSAKDLSLQVLNQLFQRNSIDPKVVDFFAVGSTISLKTPDQAQHKAISYGAGMVRADSEQVEKACSSALVACYRAAQSIWYEGADFAVGGGVDIMSQDPEAAKRALACPISGKMMYKLADEFADYNGVSREAHAAYSKESYRLSEKYLYDTGPRAVIKMETGMKPEHFLVHDELAEKYKNMDFDRGGKPIKDCKVISFASSSKPADGAGFILFASERAVLEYDLKPQSKFVAFGRSCGPDPKNFVAEPLNAINNVLFRANKTLDEVDYFLLNEAFATSPLYFMRYNGIPRTRINPRGGAIARGHPLGMSGARLVIEADHIIKQENKNLIAVSLCNAPGEATAALIGRA